MTSSLPLYKEDGDGEAALIIEGHRKVWLGLFRSVLVLVTHFSSRAETAVLTSHPLMLALVLSRAFLKSTAEIMGNTRPAVTLRGLCRPEMNLIMNDIIIS